VKDAMNRRSSSLDHVLCVGANLVARQRIVADFDAVGYAVDACGDQTLARLPLGAYALAIVDATLSDGSGLRLVASLRAAAPALPILVTSDQIEVGWRLKALEAGAVDCVGKPCDPEHLLARALAALHRGRDPGAEAPKPAAHSASVAREILVVDDSATYAYALNDELRKDGHDVALASTGREALAFATARTPDLIVLDVFLPDVGGFDVCAKMRESPALQDTPVLMLTGRERSAIRERAQKVHDFPNLRR